MEDCHESTMPLLASSSCPFDRPTMAQRSSSARPCGRLCFGDPRYGGLDFLVRSAAETMPASEVIDLGRPIRGADCDAAERRLQGLQEILTEPMPCRDRKLGIIGQIRQTFDRCDLAKQKVSHEEGLREPRS